MGKFNFIAIGGVARSGKDTLCKTLQSILAVKTKRIALADALKQEMSPYLKNHFGIDAFTTNPSEKELIRDLFVAHAKIRRKQSLGTHWVNIITPQIKDLISQNIVPIVTDIRYYEYPEDEVPWVLNNGGYLIHITRTLAGVTIEPANEDERNNDPLVKKSAHMSILWPTLSTEEERINFTSQFVTLPWT